MPEQFKLSNPPIDTISNVEFAPSSSQFLIASSWDTELHLYDVNTNVRKCKMEYQYPVLDFCYVNSDTVWAGGLGNHIRSFNINTGQDSQVGSHDKAVSCVHNVDSAELIATGSWDGTVALWDPRKLSQTSELPQPGEVYTMDSCVRNGASLLVVGTDRRNVYIWDLRRLDQPLQTRESNLKYQTRCIRCFPNGQGYALASIEGRVAVEFFDLEPDSQRMKYAFKCHRSKVVDAEEELIYPVNTIAFHKEYSTFATGGCDAIVNVWDGFNRKRLVQLPNYPTSISSLAFSDDGSMLAIASSYTWEKGEITDCEEPNIFVRHPSDQEVRPKQQPQQPQK